MKREVQFTYAHGIVVRCQEKTHLEGVEEEEEVRRDAAGGYTERNSFISPDFNAFTGIPLWHSACRATTLS